MLCSQEARRRYGLRPGMAEHLLSLARDPMIEEGAPNKKRAPARLYLIASGIGCLAFTGLMLLVFLGVMKSWLQDANVAKVVSNDCMAPTIGPRDCVPSVQSYSLSGWTPTRGDVVYFATTVERSEGTIRRLVGLPGDHVQRIDGRLFVNGTELSQPWAAESPTAELTETLNGFSYRTLIAPDSTPQDAATEVDETRFLVIGDNRASGDPSCDWQLVPIDLVAGKVVNMIRDCEGKVRDGEPLVLTEMSFGLATKDGARYFAMGLLGLEPETLPQPSEWNEAGSP